MCQDTSDTLRTAGWSLYDTVWSLDGSPLERFYKIDQQDLSELIFDDAETYYDDDDVLPQIHKSSWVFRKRNIHSTKYVRVNSGCEQRCTIFKGRRMFKIYTKLAESRGLSPWRKMK